MDSEGPRTLPLPAPAGPSRGEEDPSRVHAARRRRVGERMGDAALVLAAGGLQTRSNDTEHRFRVDTNFHYLSGLEEPGAVLILRPLRTPALTLFVPEQSERDAIYNGPRPGLEALRQQIGADAAHPLAALEVELPRLLDGLDAVYLPLGGGPSCEPAVRAAIETLRARERAGEVAPECLRDARGLLGEERMVKDAGALACLRRAIEISGEAHLAAMRATRPGLFEYEIAAVIEGHFLRRGTGPGYTSIVGAGANATVLHYIANRGPLRAGDLLLVDAGAEWALFTGDITRVWPVSGRFGPAQRDAYEVVLAANEAGIAAATIDSSLDAIHEVALRRLCEGMRALGLLTASVDEIREKELYKKYYPHRTSHWLGADVHDLGRYNLRGVARPLAAGYVLTVEPGLYIPADDASAPPELRGLGIRIEDDVLVTAAGPEVLTAGVPKRVAEIEALLGA
ncbi:aminopeptidase P N-terminal domain-containing protein [Nannocystis sp.]|uniref:aminopeptidase P N-terminal domain-containing protein n=1 Tax=Nannocystis sp. TaxID=1962667 RepID=UPI002422AF3D|nr:aminopeptidase P N-terminal domain-containing protein [Nannocystis sp.]MBK7824285.1 aminopeptidase P N-terminal domain-containing protein [Nannocystis sp.]MBK9755298.1 aminopeptidase P N-terminal domain-containing protein [Nannocystis sp.]